MSGASDETAWRPLQGGDEDRNADYYAGTGKASAAMEDELAWTFNVASGVAHGYAWPWQLPRVGDFPGDFVRMLTVTALMVDSAHQLAFLEGGHDPMQVINAWNRRRR